MTKSILTVSVGALLLLGAACKKADDNAATASADPSEVKPAAPAAPAAPTIPPVNAGPPPAMPAGWSEVDLGAADTTLKGWVAYLPAGAKITGMNGAVSDGFGVSIEAGDLGVMITPAPYWEQVAYANKKDAAITNYQQPSPGEVRYDKDGHTALTMLVQAGNFTDNVVLNQKHECAPAMVTLNHPDIEQVATVCKSIHKK